MFYKIFAVGRDFSKELNRNNISAHASSAAFFIFLSLIPMLLLLCAIIPLTTMTEGNLVMAAKEALPSVFVPFAITIIEEVYDKSSAVISIAAIVVIWSAAKGILSIMRALNAINRVEETRNYFVLRFWASIYTVIFLGVIVLSLLIMVFGNVLVEILLSDLPNIKFLFGMIMNFRFMFVWIILALFFMVLYSMIPNKKLKFRLQLPGAVFASVGWSIFSWGFSMYVDYFNAFDMYGSLSTIVMVMLWLYICMYILMLGAEINRYFRPAIKYYYEKRNYS